MASTNGKDKEPAKNATSVNQSNSRDLYFWLDKYFIITQTHTDTHTHTNSHIQSINFERQTLTQ
jgi:hypothetical protein